MPDVKPDSEETRQLLDELPQKPHEVDSLFARHRLRLREVIRLRLDARLRARVGLSDVVQETEMEAYRRIDDYLERRPMPFHLWLRKTALERILMLRRRHLRAAARAVDRELPLADHSSIQLARNLEGQIDSPSETLNSQELAERVRQAITQLSDSDREIILMRTYEGLGYDEIGVILEIEPAAARKRNGRALIRLHRLLSADGLTESQV